MKAFLASLASLASLAFRTISIAKAKPVEIDGQKKLKIDTLSNCDTRF